jgi:hypothetical protein
MLRSVARLREMAATTPRRSRHQHQVSRLHRDVGAVPIAIPRPLGSAGASLMPSPPSKRPSPPLQRLDLRALRSGRTAGDHPGIRLPRHALRGPGVVPVSITTSSPSRAGCGPLPPILLDRVGHGDHAPARPSTATHTGVPPASAISEAGREAMRGRRPPPPARTRSPRGPRAPPTAARIPFPGTDRKSSAADTSRPFSGRRGPPRRPAGARNRSPRRPRAAAARAPPPPRRTRRPRQGGRPPPPPARVRFRLVETTVSTFCAVSRAAPSRTRIPSSAPSPSPP